MAWSNVHPDAPTNDDGVPIHPENGYPICGREKTDATDVNGNKRWDYAFCLQAAGWGTDRTTGHCRKHNGHGVGGLEGWQNQNARHLLYSERMNDDDAEVFDAVVQTDDGDLLSVDDMADMLKQSIGWEFTRLVRAVDKIPEAERVDKYSCPKCGNTYTASESSPLPEVCTGFDMSDGNPTPCDVRSGDFEPTGERFVSFGDKAIERKESHLANLIDTYKKISDGVDVNVDGDHDVTVDDDGVTEVDITHVQVTEPPTDEDGDEDDGD
jgi:hypothetical protein